MRKANLGGRAAPAGLSVLSMAAVLALGTMSSGAFALGGGVAPAPSVVRVSADPRIVDLGAADATDVKSISIGLAVRNKPALDAFVLSVADPKSANFRKLALFGSATLSTKA